MSTSKLNTLETSPGHQGGTTTVSESDSEPPEPCPRHYSVPSGLLNKKLLTDYRYPIRLHRTAAIPGCRYKPSFTNIDNECFSHHRHRHTDGIFQRPLCSSRICDCFFPPDKNQPNRRAGQSLGTISAANFRRQQSA